MSSDTTKFPKNLVIVVSGLVDMVEEIVVCDDLFVFVIINRASKFNVNLIVSDIIFMLLDAYIRQYVLDAFRRSRRVP